MNGAESTGKFTIEEVEWTLGSREEIRWSGKCGFPARVVKEGEGDEASFQEVMRTWGVVIPVSEEFDNLVTCLRGVWPVSTDCFSLGLQ
jgi:hypothetical protein